MCIQYHKLMLLVGGDLTEVLDQPLPISIQDTTTIMVCNEPLRTL